MKIFILFLSICLTSALDTKVISANLGELQNGKVNSDVQIVYHYSIPNPQRSLQRAERLRLHTYSSEANATVPVIFTARQEQGTLFHSF